MCEREGEDWEGMGARYGNRDVKCGTGWYKMLSLIISLVDTLLLKQWD